MTNIDASIKASGGPVAVARRLGISVQRLANWAERGVPIEHCARFETAVGGLMRRWDLRPADWWRIWPELIGMPGSPELTSATPAQMATAPIAPAA